MTPGWPRRLLPALAAGLAAWSLVPLALWWDTADPVVVSSAWQTWITGSAVTALAVILALVLGRGRVELLVLQGWRRVMGIPAPVFVAAAAVLFAALTVLCTLRVFDGNPRNVDGFAQLFQARIFLAGRLYNPPPAELANFATLQMILGPDKWLSQYPPGQSAVLAAGLALGRWWLLNPVIGALFVLATWRVARWCAGEAAARLTLILLCLSGFVIAVAASEMSHLPAATLGMGAAALATLATERRGPLWPLATGLGLGLMACFRPLDAVAASAVVGLLVVGWRRLPDSRFPIRDSRLSGLLLVGAGGIIGAVPVLWFNAVTNGSPTTFGYTALWGPQHSLGFHPVPWGVPLTLTRAIARSGYDLHQLNAYLLDATLPVLLVVAAGYLAGRAQLQPRDAVPFAGVGALVGLLFFYWHRDVFYGPRFLYSAVAWFEILLARGIVLLRRTGRRPDGSGPGLTAAFAAGMAILVGLVALTPTRLRAYRNTTPIFALHPDRDAAAAGLRNAVVLLPDGWGSRLIARMWQLGIPVRASSRINSNIDACTLERALAAAEHDAGRRALLPRTLDSLAALRQPGIRRRITPDPNLRLPADTTLPAECAEEVAVDRRGYFSYAPFLWLNDASLDGNIVWARDLGPGNARLFDRYPARRFVRYVPGEGGRPMFVPAQGPGW